MITMPTLNTALKTTVPLADSQPSSPKQGADTLSVQARDYFSLSSPANAEGTSQKTCSDPSAGTPKHSFCSSQAGETGIDAPALPVRESQAGSGTDQFANASGTSAAPTSLAVICDPSTGGEELVEPIYIQNDADAAPSGSQASSTKDAAPGSEERVKAPETRPGAASGGANDVADDSANGSADGIKRISADCSTAEGGNAAESGNADAEAAAPNQGTASANSIPQNHEASAEGESPSVQLKAAGNGSLSISLTTAAAKKTDPIEPSPLSDSEQEALRKEQAQQERLRTEAIYERMRVERQIHEAKRLAILADLQTEIMRIWQDVFLRRKKAEDDYMKDWHKIFLGA